MSNDFIPPQIRDGGAGPAPTSGQVRAPDYRQIQQPAEVDEYGFYRASREAGESAEGKARALSSIFNEFENASADIYNKVQRQRGAQAGAAAGAAGNGAPKTGLQAVTAYGQGYDAAIHSTYITQAQLGLEKSITGLEQSNIGDPATFQAQASTVVQKAIKAADPLYQPELSQWAQARIQAGVARQSEQHAADVRNQALATYQSATPDLITSALHTAAALPVEQGNAVIAKLESDDRDRLNALVASHVITPEQANDLHQKMVDSATQQMTGQKIDISLRPILATMRSNLEASDKAILQDDPNLSPEENAARQVEYEKERDEYVKAQTNAHVNDLAAVHQQLAGGAFGQGVESRLHQLYQAGALSQEGLYSGLAESLRNQKKRIGDEADMTLVDAIVHGDPGHAGPLDPQNKAEAAAVDKYFQEHVAQSGAVSGDQYAAGAAEITRQTGIVPASVSSHIRVGLLSGDPVRTANAAALAARIEAVNPRVDVFGKSTRLAALSTMVNANLEAGLSPKDAYDLAVRTADVPPEVRKIRDGNYAQALKAQGPNSVALQKALDHEASNALGFGHSPPAPIAMQAEYSGLVHEYYSQTGNLQQARELAERQLHTTWAVSKVNGSAQLMKWPVSDAAVPVVRADIAQAAKSAGFTGDPSTIHLISDSRTDLSGGKSYALVYTDPKTGAQDVLLDKENRPLRYHMPSGPDFVAARQRIINQKLAEARQQRAEQRQNSAEHIEFEQQLSDHYLHAAPIQ